MPHDADFLVFNTCTIREKADDRFVAHLMDARAAKQRDPSKVIVVGGCWSESMKDELFEQLPVRRPRLRPRQHPPPGRLRPGRRRRSRAGTSRPSTASPATCREARPRVPGLAPDLDRLQLRLRLLHRALACAAASTAAHPDDLVREAERLAADGVRELTLLGQNVNSYGRDLPPAARSSFGELLRALDGVAGIERIRYTSPHPKDMRDDVIAAHGRVPGGVRAPAPAGAVGVDARAQGDAPDLLAASATCAWSSGSARRCPTSP